MRKIIYGVFLFAGFLAASLGLGKQEAQAAPLPYAVALCGRGARAHRLRLLRRRRRAKRADPSIPP